MGFDAYDGDFGSYTDTLNRESGTVDFAAKVPVPPSGRTQWARAISWAKNRVEPAEAIINPEGKLKAKIEALFASGKTLYFSEISEHLGIDLRLAVQLCKELIAEGKIYVEKGS